jgi:hypothetical protein
MTNYKRAHFNKLKAEQEKHPDSERTPHKQDKKGFAIPLTEREIHIAEGRITFDKDGNEV